MEKDAWTTTFPLRPCGHSWKSGDKNTCSSCYRRWRRTLEPGTRYGVYGSEGRDWAGRMRRRRAKWGRLDRSFEARVLREIGHQLNLPDQESVRKHLREHGLE